MAEKGCLKDGLFNNLEVAGLLAFNGTKIEFDDNLTLSSSTTQKPVLTLENTTNDANSAILKFVKDKGAAGAANDVNGLIQFFGDDANQEQVMFSELKSQVKVHTDGQEGGKLTFSVAEHDGTLTAGLTIEDGNADGELDVTIGAGTASLTTVAGDLTVTSDAIFTAGSRNSNLEVVTTNTAKDLTGITSDKLVIFTGTQEGAITLPQATANNVGMVITIAFGADASTTAFKLGFANSGSTTIIGQTTLGSNDGSEAVDGFVITNNAKSLEIDADDATAAGGAKGSVYTFTYFAANQVFCIAKGMVTTDTPALDAGHSTTTGTS